MMTKANPNVAPMDTPKDGDSVLLRDILVDEQYHSRSGTNRRTVFNYETVYRNELKAELKDSNMPPLEVAYINGVCVLFDGFHRYRAMKNCGITQAVVNVHHGMNYKELPYAASRFNLNHGLPMSRQDVRKIVFKAYVKTAMNRDRKRYKSYREIAEDFNNCFAYNTIRNWMKEDFPAVFRAMSKGDDDEEDTIEFTPLDHDMVNKCAAIEDLDRFDNRYHSIKCEATKVDLANELQGRLEGVLEGLPEGLRTEEELDGSIRYLLPDLENEDF